MKKEREKRRREVNREYWLLLERTRNSIYLSILMKYLTVVYDL